MSLKHLHRKLRNTEFEGNEFDPISAFEAQAVPHQSIVIPKDRFTEPSENYTYEIKQVSERNLKLGQALETLNTYQLQAVFSEDSKVLLSAMVGSGKTTVLTHKILYLHFIKAIPLSKMIVLTFTNKAAREIRERILSFYEDSEAIQSEELRYFGTFHSVARQLIKEHPQLSKLGFSPTFSIMDKEAQEEFLHRLILTHELDVKYQNKLDQRLKLYRNEKQILYANMKNEDDLPQLLDISRKEKQANNLMDFDDLISIANWLLKQECPLEAKWVIVDEFQDCNSEQVQLLNYLSVKGSSFFAVGDPNQSIYAWRGSTDQIFESYIADTSCCMMRLPLNYRSSGQLLSAAACLLNQEQEDLQATRTAGNKLRLVNHFDDNQEAFYYARQFKALHSSGTAWEQIAILFRTRQQINIFESIFQKEGIPFQVVIKSNLKDYPALFWLKKLLLAGLQPNDLDSILSVFTSSDFGCLKNGKVLLNAFSKFNNEKTFNSKIEAFTAFLQVKYPKEETHIKLGNALLAFQDELLNTTTNFDLYSYFNLDEQLKPTSVHYNENANQVKQAIKELELYIQHQSFGNRVEAYQAAMGQVSLEGHFQINTGIKKSQNGVHLLTIHAAKGLEFDHVFLSGANTGLIPLNRQKGGPKHLQEEKRLLFVALTRAKNNMEISWHSQSTAWNAEEGPSYFLNAIPSVLIERIESTKPEIINKPVDPQEAKDSPWKKDMKVSHPKYGKGIVVSSTDKEITCDFGKFGEKSFAPQWAALKIL
ncbi:ATP-dependent helicase [Ancylomarina sp. YFZ004]